MLSATPPARRTVASAFRPSLSRVSPALVGDAAFAWILRSSPDLVAADECWFCLSNPKVTKHLIASIGTETYATLPKGQVCSTDSSPVPGGGHVLIIPVRPL